MYPKCWMGRPWTCMVSVLQGVNSVPKVLDGEALNMHGICSPRGEQCTQSAGWGGPEHAWYLFSKGWTVYPKCWMGRPWTCMVSVLQGVNSVPKVLDGEALNMHGVLQGVNSVPKVLDGEAVNMHGICSPRGEQCTQSSGWGGPEHAWYLFSKRSTREAFFKFFFATVRATGPFL